MNVAHEPSMDDILKSIRRIIRNDQEVASKEKEEEQEEETLQLVAVQEEPKKEDDNLIRMKIQDQNRVRILEQKLRTIEAEYEQKLQLHRRKMTDYRRKNQELTAAVDAYKTRLELVSNSLKTAHDCLEKLQVRNKALKNKILQMARFEQGTAVLRTIQREFTNLYHPDRAEGDNISRTVRGAVYNEFNQILKGVQTSFQTRRV